MTDTDWPPLPSCPFCQYAENTRDDVMVITPLNPVTPGHVLIVPRQHVYDAGTDPKIAAKVMYVAADYIVDVGHCNLITSCGVLASQTVFHFHLHVVPRRKDDRLLLPWSSDKEVAAAVVQRAVRAGALDQADTDAHGLQRWPRSEAHNDSTPSVT